MGRLLGVPELFATAVTAEILLLACVAYVWLRPARIGIARRLRPERTQAGEHVEVDVVVTNVGRARTPNLDLVDGRRPAIHLAPLGAGESRTVGYQLATVRRGLLAVGPMHVVVGDPLGMASRSSVVGAWSTLTVHPRVQKIDPPPPARSSAPDNSVRLASAAAMAGEFHALRPYVEGDDLRRVHWPTSARRDDLFVREDTLPSARSTVVALDVRRHVHDPGSLEAAVSAAASIIQAATYDDGLVRLVTTGGFDSTLSGGPAHVTDLLDALAGLEADNAVDLSPLAALVTASRGGSLVVLVCSPATASGDLDALAGPLGSHDLLVCRVAPDLAFTSTWARLVAHPTEIVAVRR